MEAHLLLHAPDGEARRIGLDDERADLAGVGAAVGHRGDDVGAGHPGIGDEALATVEDPGVAVARGTRAGPARVASRAWLGEAVGADHLAGGHRPQVLLLLCVGARHPERVAAEAGVGADDDADRSGDPGQLLDRDRVGQAVEPRAADLLRVGHAEQPERCRLTDDLHRELALALQVVRDRGDAPLGEVAHGATDLLVLWREGEVHGRRGSVRGAPSLAIGRPGRRFDRGVVLEVQLRR